MMKKEVELLTDSRRNIDHAAAQTERPLRIYNKCRENRERRIGIDRVKDSVEKRLQEEQETIIHYQQLMREIVNQCTFQLESNNSALELLTSDLTNKDEALNINKATRDINKNNKSFKDMVKIVISVDE